MLTNKIKENKKKYPVKIILTKKRWDWKIYSKKENEAVKSEVKHTHNW